MCYKINNIIIAHMIYSVLNSEALTCCVPEFKIEDMKYQLRVILEQCFKYISSEVKNLYYNLTK